ncbi:hypothetical protein CRG98_007611 [Punica granatum]|uniref:Uncharacterized protein n=1 Tax=Punica granatum TaxID=22663 RepID=A0A2I0KU41_PUNGR|nr:hypothetical protein CRG98_007611 [Punica granatum]
MKNALLKESAFERGTGACPASCVRHGRLPGELRDARALTQRVCDMHGRLPDKLHDAWALAQQISPRTEAVVLGIRQTCICQRKTSFGVYILIPAYRTRGANNSCQSYHTAVMKMCKEEMHDSWNLHKGKGRDLWDPPNQGYNDSTPCRKVSLARRVKESLLASKTAKTTTRCRFTLIVVVLSWSSCQSCRVSSFLAGIASFGIRASGSKSAIMSHNSSKSIPEGATELSDSKILMEAMMSEMRRVMRLEFEQVHEQIDLMEQKLVEQP